MFCIRNIRRIVSSHLILIIYQISAEQRADFLNIPEHLEVQMKLKVRGLITAVALAARLNVVQEASSWRNRSER